MRPGEFIGLLGPAGSGKSTLLHSISGAIPHFFTTGVTGGSVEVEGKAVAERRLSDLSRFVGTVAQDPEAQIFNLFVQDEVTWTAQNLAMPAAEIRSRLDEVSGTFRLNELMDMMTPSLSGGQKQLVALAAAIVAKPRILLLDEPTAELDSAATLSFYQVLGSLRGAITMIVAEHKLELLAAFADRLILLREGTLEADARPPHLLADRDLLASCGYEQPAVYRFLKQVAATEGIEHVPTIWDVDAAAAWLRSVTVPSASNV